MMWTTFRVTVNRYVLKQVIVSVAALLCLLTAGLADSDHDMARRLKKMGNIVPLERILDTLGETRDVRILEINLRERAGRLIYHVEYIDPSGVVIERQYDAQSGALLQTREDE